jgi:hypothetical protein
MKRIYQMIELIQPRCSLRFGVGACEATGTPKCYNTWSTCKFRSAFDLDGVIRWRFVPDGQTLHIPYAATGSNDITPRPYPCVRSISTQPTIINIGAIRDGESPFGIRSTISVDLAEFPFDDRDGDFYRDDRTIRNAGFWQKFIARVGDAIQQLQVRHYVWREDQTLAEATVSLFDVRNVVANKGGCRLEGDDPLQRVDARKAQFPRATGASLQASITNTQTSDIRIIGIGAEIAVAYGNTGARKFLRIEREIIEYTGSTESDGIHTLTGVVRGVLGTTAEAHDADEAVQRVGRYERIRQYRVALDLMENHSTLDAALIDTAGWEAEGSAFLPTLQTNATIADPQDVNSLIGELARDGLFQVWWDERSQLIKMQAVRPPLPGGVTRIDQADNIIAAQFDRTPDDRLTRIIARYNPRDPFSDAPENFRVVQVRIDTDAEGPFQADGTTREKVINSRWINTIANGRLVAASLLRRYTVTPVYAAITLDGKDAGLQVGGTIDLTTPDVIDAEGNPVTTRWEVISWRPDWRENRVTVRCQQSPYIGKFAIIMPNDAPDYADATAQERESGCWMADETTGLMPDGSDPYLLW